MDQERLLQDTINTLKKVPMEEKTIFQTLISDSSQTASQQLCSDLRTDIMDLKALHF